MVYSIFSYSYLLKLNYLGVIQNEILRSFGSALFVLQFGRAFTIDMLLICCVRHNVCASAFRMRCMQCIWKCCHKISEHGINRQKELWLICVVLWCKFLIANRSTLVSKAPHAIAHTHTHTHCVCNIISFFFLRTAEIWCELQIRMHFRYVDASEILPTALKCKLNSHTRTN